MARWTSPPAASQSATLQRCATARPPAATMPAATSSAALEQVVHHDRCALGRQQFRVAAADALAGAGDDRDLAVECTHESSPSRAVGFSDGLSDRRARAGVVAKKRYGREMATTQRTGGSRATARRVVHRSHSRSCARSHALSCDERLAVRRRTPLGSWRRSTAICRSATARPRSPPSSGSRRCGPLSSPRTDRCVSSIRSGSTRLGQDRVADAPGTPSDHHDRGGRPPGAKQPWWGSNSPCSWPTCARCTSWNSGRRSGCRLPTRRPHWRGCPDVDAGGRAGDRRGGARAPRRPRSRPGHRGHRTVRRDPRGRPRGGAPVDMAFIDGTTTKQRHGATSTRSTRRWHPALSSCSTTSRGPRAWRGRGARSLPTNASARHHSMRSVGVCLVGRRACRTRLDLHLR